MITSAKRFIFISLHCLYAIFFSFCHCNCQLVTYFILFLVVTSILNGYFWRCKLKHTKRQVNELCFLTCVFLPCLSPQCYFLSGYDGQIKRVFTTLSCWLLNKLESSMVDTKHPPHNVSLGLRHPLLMMSVRPPVPRQPSKIPFPSS